MDTYGLSPQGYLIFLDRYSVKGDTAQAKIGDLIIARNSSGQREIMTIVSIDRKFHVLSSEDNHTIYHFEPDEVDLPLEYDPKEMWDRMAYAAVKTKGDFNPVLYEKFRSALDNWLFVPGGRIMAGLGNKKADLSLYNCYVLPSPKDSRKGILETLGQMTEIMARGGGVGISLATLRPKDAPVRGVNGRSSGAVSWGKIYSDTTGLISQGGSRRGALMLMLPVWHPDIEDFIVAKKTAGQYTNCNMSVIVTDAFMEAVEKDLDWPLVFPLTDNEKYNTDWNGLVTYDGPWQCYRIVKARDLWNKICQSAWESGEPGIWFIDRANAYSLGSDPLIATNPCGEQGLPAWGVCNLGALNLPKFVSNKMVDWSLLESTVESAIFFLDCVIDANVYTFKENEEQQKKERRIGLNFMGLADMLGLLEIPYGSPESFEFVDKLMNFIKQSAYRASVLSRRGDKRIPDNPFINSINDSILTDMMITDGLRHTTLLTAAPTGTTGTMVGVSTGIEPWFSISWQRKSRLGTFTEYVQPVKEWMEKHPNEPLPDWVVTAQDLDPELHVKMQSIIQRHVDASISKTCNLPSTATVEDVDHIYRLMYDSGCKGGTVYRDQSRSEQVLNLIKEDNHKCPECGEKLIEDEGCQKCMACGFAMCSI